MTDEDPTTIRPFSEWLMEQNDGTTNEEMAGHLAALTQAVKDTGKKGTLTLVIEVAPFDKGGALVVSDKIKVSLPEHDRERSIWFSDTMGNLQRNNPQQPMFEGLRELPPVARFSEREAQ